MESLRIFYEKVRDGTMDEILSIAGITNLNLYAEQPGINTPSMASNGSDQNDTRSMLQQLLAEQRDLSTEYSNRDDQRYFACITQLCNCKRPTFSIPRRGGRLRQQQRYSMKQQADNAADKSAVHPDKLQV